MKNFILSILFLHILFYGVSQSNMKPDARLTAAMNKLRFMEGQWKGNGWIQFGPQKNTFVQTEDIRFKVNGTVLQIEGLGVDAKNTSQVIHEAFALISYDQAGDRYLMRAIRGNGNYVDAETRLLEDGAFEWKFKSPQAGEIRYTIRLVNSQWVEKGEINRDGTNWIQFFEMTLNKIN
ncbi:hypothetical protein LC607_36300 [Nostoc sp. CHAB 5824]|nr:hypothetical protein [Nostoc sp. CHAB 5824]